MNQSSRQHGGHVNHGEAFRFASRSLAAHPAVRKQIVALQRKLYDYHSSFAIEEWAAEFEDGTRLALLFKDLSPDGLLPGARQTRPQFYYRPDREIVVYRELLASASPGTAICYGSVSDPEQDRYWLLLEKVCGVELYMVGDLQIWCDVARWLAGMHCRLGEKAALRRSKVNLTTYDADFYSVWIDRAERFNSQREAVTAINSLQMSWLSDQCRRAVRHLGSLSTTFIHGEFYASNILIDNRQSPMRICPVDWETAAIGPGLMDVAALIAGRWTESQRRQLAQAYFDALPLKDGCWSNFQEMTLSLVCSRLFQAIRWLGWSANWEPPPDHRFDWAAEAKQMAELLDGQDRL